jgi:hypothetical protein
MTEEPEVNVKVSREVLAGLVTWAGPFLVRAEQLLDGEWTLILKRYTSDPKAVFDRITDAA